MAEIFRKKSLERLASPEQLDKMIRITSPMVWIAAIAVTLILGGTLVWAFLGELPTKVETGGIYADNMQTKIVYASSSGKISLNVSKDYTVEEGDVVAILDNADVEKNIERLDGLINNISAITLISVNDIASSEAGSLLQIKTNYQSIGLTREQYNAQMRELEGMKREYEQNVSSAKSAYQSAQEKYINALGDDSYNTTFYNYNEAMAKLQYAQEMLGALSQAFAECQEQLAQALAAWGPDDPVVIALEQQSTDLQLQLSIAQEEVSQLQATYDGAESAYRQAYTSQASSQANAQWLYNDMTEKGQLYNAAENRLESIKSQIASLSVQKVADDIRSEQESQLLAESFDLTKQAIISDLQNELDTLYKQRGNLTVTAPVSGVVSQISVQNDQIIGMGTEILRIRRQTGDDETGEVVCFVAVADAKKFTEGMQASITPSTVSEQEYGHINGVVISVGENYATTIEMQEVLGEDLMVNFMQQQTGPAIKIVIKLNKDPGSANGYEWSNRRGESILLSEGTIMGVNVITEKSAPITKLLPYLKQLMDVEIKE